VKKERKCRDIFCVIVAILYIAGMIAIIPLYKLYNFSNTFNLFAPYDKFRRGCGIEEV